jgi:hypothetical protein
VLRGIARHCATRIHCSCEQALNVRPLPEPRARVAAVVEVDEPVLVAAAVKPVRLIQAGHGALPELLELDLGPVL